MTGGSQWAQSAQPVTHAEADDACQRRVTDTHRLAVDWVVILVTGRTRRKGRQRRRASAAAPCRRRLTETSPCEGGALADWPTANPARRTACAAASMRYAT